MRLRGGAPVETEEAGEAGRVFRLWKWRERIKDQWGVEGEVAHGGHTAVGT
jgi:hypothetical protein